MGLYDSWFPGLNIENTKKVSLVIVGLIALVILAFLALPLVLTPVLQAQLNGPIDLSTNAQGYPVRPNSELSITLSNPSPQVVSNVTVFVMAQDAKSILVFPSSFVIETLDKKRTLIASIRPNPTQPVLSGTYLIEIKALMGTEQYTTYVELEVKNPEQ